MKYVFSKPYEFEGKEYNEIDAPVEGLTGRDISEVKKQFTDAGHFSAVPVVDYDYCTFLLARVSKKPMEFFYGLPAQDYCAVCQKVGTFLMKSG